ncbi:MULTISPECIES: hypothetical protein [Kitasatospora]|uniref:Uncharacterized protein n=1 Tax=Kitasatospora setae (strain ATCC 33774 / DSM 43861 / JCM 3304 / KCC A-0304 / NBRC 14216 / KM-6054) TaxID=452652 RepID=E4NAW0_KITSK|nr:MULTISPECIES: hypothetical protein [Kitasatospora]BAJ28341.1 hypothetical protein KSE_25280 [Kitasatospora setae KM-6054]
MVEDRQQAAGQQPEELAPAAALALAERARAAARRPAPMPWWYGPGVGATLAVYCAAIGQSFQRQAQWLIPLCAAALMAVMAAILRTAMRASGVAARLEKAKVPPKIMRAFGVTVLAAVLAWLGTWLATGDQGWAMAAAGLVAGLAVWGVIALANRDLKEQSMSSQR